jgi:glycerophosphoryl diester phosphodiesterase
LQIPERFGALPLDRRWVIERARAVGLRVDYWVVNDPQRAQALLALGADGIVTDDPARLAPVVARARLGHGST